MSSLRGHRSSASVLIGGGITRLWWASWSATCRSCRISIGCRTAGALAPHRQSYGVPSGEMVLRLFPPAFGAYCADLIIAIALL